MPGTDFWYGFLSGTDFFHVDYKSIYGPNFHMVRYEFFEIEYLSVPDRYGPNIFDDVLSNWGFQIRTFLTAVELKNRLFPI